MAQADSVPSAIRPPFTGEGPYPFTKSRFAGRLYPDATPVITSIDDLINALVLGHDQAKLIKRWREIGALSENSTHKPNARWHTFVTAGIPVGSYAAAVCYATAAIYLGWYPWNFLLIGLPFLIRNKPLHERTFAWCSSRVPTMIGPADRRFVHWMKAAFLSGSRP